MKKKQSLPSRHLGQKTSYNFEYNASLLEPVPYSASSSASWVSLVCTEFTSLCPVTQQPDFARIYINYIPADRLVESKSFKLYLFSFRNHGAFHESCVQLIAHDLFRVLKPLYLEAIGEFTPRGGIAIFPYVQKFAASHRALAKERLNQYAPGKYSLRLGQPYA